jgi:aspartate-semialdehyde dehydrogenase
VDAASTLRLSEKSTLILDPLNEDLIKKSIKNGIKDFVGANCTVSLLLLGIAGLVETGEVEWISSMSYQASSGAGAEGMRELLGQNQVVGKFYEHYNQQNPKASILEIESAVTQFLREKKNTDHSVFMNPLNLNLIPWIDSPMEGDHMGRTKEEWKAQVEARKIYQGNSLLNTSLRIDGTCVRVGALRCHSQALTIKLKKHIPLKEVEKLIQEHNDWVRVIPNERAATVSQLSPLAVSGTLKVHVGRLRYSQLGDTFLHLFTVGDQLLWGAAEPLRRVLKYF